MADRLQGIAAIQGECVQHNEATAQQSTLHRCQLLFRICKRSLCGKHTCGGLVPRSDDALTVLRRLVLSNPVLQ